MNNQTQRNQMRAADADRERVAEQLRVAHTEGRLDLAEYDERLQRSWTARTLGELQTLTGDLPQPRVTVTRVQRQINGFAVASLLLGTLWILWIGSILALAFGYIARRQIKRRGERGAGLATAGIALGWVGVGILTIILVSLWFAAPGVEQTPVPAPVG